MIVARDCTVLLDLIDEQEIEITVKDNVRVTMIDQGHTILNITLIAERNSTILYEALLINSDQRRKITTIARGPHTEVQLRIGSIAKSAQQHLIETEQIHEAPHSMSNSVIKSICYDHSRSEYNGMIMITKEGTHTEAHQQHKALLLDPQARAYARPSIEVHVDEVQCGHGSAIGQLDEEQLFYLHARGIAPKHATNLLTHAFMNDLFLSPLLKQRIYKQFNG